MALVSEKQKRALRILYARKCDAQRDYIEALEIYINIFNNEPEKEPFDKWSLWRARFKLAREDMLKQFSRYNLAINHYVNYRRVALGI